MDSSIKTWSRDAESHICFIEGHYTTSSSKATVRGKHPREQGERTEQGHADTFPITYKHLGEGKNNSPG